MKPARTLLPWTVAVASVGLTAAQFVTSTATTTAAPALTPRSNDATTVAARQIKDRVTIRTTRTVIQSTRSSTKPRSSSRKNDDDDDDNNTKTRRKTRRIQTKPSTTPPRTTTTDDNPTSTTNTPSPTATSDNTINTTATADNNNAKKTGLSAGTAAGITAGAVAAVALLAALAFLFWRRRQGGIRGAVVTGDYPRGMEDVGKGDLAGSDSASSASSSSSAAAMGAAGTGAAGAVGAGAGAVGVVGAAVAGANEKRERESETNGPGKEVVAFRVPPAGTMSGEKGFEAYPSEYPAHSPQPHQYPGGDLGEARPVSAFTAYPSPGQPVFPVSPMTPYRPETGILTTGQQQHARPESSILMTGQNPGQSRVVSYYPPAVSSPGPPGYLIPGGDRSRAVSFGSVAQLGGGPQVAELVGSPVQPRVPSFAVVIENPSPTPQAHAELP